VHDGAVTSADDFWADDVRKAVAPVGDVFGATVDHDGAAVVVRVRGDVDLVSAPELESSFVLALHECPDVLVADLTDVTFFASAGMAVLVNAQQQAGAHTRFCVVAPGRSARRPLELTGLTGVIAVYSSREDALAAD
jgi:anti-anti-sigma factor